MNCGHLRFTLGMTRCAGGKYPVLRPLLPLLLELIGRDDDDVGDGTLKLLLGEMWSRLTVGSSKPDVWTDKST